MNIGKLFQFKKYFWMLYPSKDIVAAVEALLDDPETALVRWNELGEISAAYVASLSAYWSKRFNCNVSHIEPNSIFMLLEQDEKYCKILSTNGELGWIILTDWRKNDIEEVNQ
jgi:hypothetical protein